MLLVLLEVSVLSLIFFIRCVDSDFIGGDKPTEPYQSLFYFKTTNQKNNSLQYYNNYPKTNVSQSLLRNDVKLNKEENHGLELLNFLDEISYSDEESHSEDLKHLVDDELLSIPQTQKISIDFSRNNRQLPLKIVQTSLTTQSWSTDDLNTEDSTDDGTADTLETTTTTSTTTTESVVDPTTTYLSTVTETKPESTSPGALTPCDSCTSESTTITPVITTDEGTTSSTPPIHTEPPVVDNRPEVNITYEDGSPCVFIRMNIQIRVEYETITSSTQTATITVPRNADSSESSCDQIILTWAENDAARQKLTSVTSNNLTINLNRDSTFSIADLEAQIILDSENYPDARNPFIIVTTDDLRLFETETGILYKCSRELYVNGYNGTIILSDVEVKGREEGQEITERVVDCDSEESSELALILGIVVGVLALAGVIFAIVAFTIRKRRRGRRGVRHRLLLRDIY